MGYDEEGYTRYTEVSVFPCMYMYVVEDRYRFIYRF